MYLSSFLPSLKIRLNLYHLFALIVCELGIQTPWSFLIETIKSRLFCLSALIKVDASPYKLSANTKLIEKPNSTKYSIISLANSIFVL